MHAPRAVNGSSRSAVLVALLAAALALSLAPELSAQARPYAAQAASGARRGIVLTGEPTAPTKVRPLIRPGAAQPDPNRRIIRLGEAPRGPSRPLIRPGDGTPPNHRGPLIVTANQATILSMARALRSVGEHRIAAALCRGAGCDNVRSPRDLSAAIRRGAAFIRPVVDTQRRIYSAGFRVARNEDAEDDAPEQMPRLVRVHGRNDPIAQRAYDKAGVVLSFYRTILGRRSYDDRNSPVNFVVHYGEDNTNASWQAAHETTFGQAIGTFGDGDHESRSQVEGEMSYHELTHGVVDETAGLVYEGETGALNEHFADALAETAQQWERGESVRESNWLFGEETFRTEARTRAIRSFAQPELYEQPGHVRDVRRYDLSDDDGGVHTLSGIPNRAFYSASVRLGGHSWEHTGLVWYTALREHLGPRATFRDAALATVRSAVELFGERSREARAVRAGWADVGIRVPLYREGSRAPMRYGEGPPAAERQAP